VLTHSRVTTAARRAWRPGLRWRATAAFTLGGLVLSMVLVVSTYTLARGFLISQRENTALRQAYADASYVRNGLLTAGAEPSDVINDVSPRAGTLALITIGDLSYSSGLGASRSQLPAELISAVSNGTPAITWTTVAGQQSIVVGIPLSSVSAQYFEIASVDELERTLTVLRWVLLSVGVVTAAAAALLGRAVSARVIRPLDEVAEAASAIAAGQIDTRLEPTEDPDLVAIVASFNTMVDALATRIQRETRFTADVAHELRSPLTTLVTGVALLSARRDDLPPRSQQALGIVSQELERFRRTLQDLLELARMDAASASSSQSHVQTDLAALVRHTLADSGRDVDLLAVDDPGVVLQVKVDRREVERALGNLLENAEHYGGGVVAVGIRHDARSAYVSVDDAGPGVAAEDRERIFARFARGSNSRGSTKGTGLGLSLVAETAHRHHGAVWCTQAPAGGARFILRLPLETGSETGLTPRSHA
jgi:two-component system, OmpR family, sensor histidine kinase MtrB